MCRDVLAVVPKSLEGYWLLVSLSEGFIAMLWIVPLQLLSGAPLPALPGRNCLMGQVSLLRLSVIGYQLLVIGYCLLVSVFGPQSSCFWIVCLLMVIGLQSCCPSLLVCLFVHGYWPHINLDIFNGWSKWLVEVYPMQ